MQGPSVESSHSHHGNEEIHRQHSEVYSNSQFDVYGDGTSVDGEDHVDYNDQHDNEVSYVVQNGVNGTSKLIIGGPIGESNDDPDEEDALHRANRAMVFKKAAEVISNVVNHIEESQDLCGKNKTEQGNSSPAQQNRNKQQYQRAKEQLTNESRQFVTASKLFVKSATESEGQLMECLNHCVQMIDRIGNVTRDVAMLTPTPLQTQTLLAKVRDVADTYLQTVQAAGKAIGKDMNDPSMGVLMKKATSLASVLTTLMRSLRVFT